MEYLVKYNKSDKNEITKCGIEMKSLSITTQIPTWYEHIIKKILRMLNTKQSNAIPYSQRPTSAHTSANRNPLRKHFQFKKNSSYPSEEGTRKK